MAIPAIPAERDYILTYSPYQNVQAGACSLSAGGFFVTAHQRTTG